MSEDSIDALEARLSLPLPAFRAAAEQQYCHMNDVQGHKTTEFSNSNNVNGHGRTGIEAVLHLAAHLASESETDLSLIEELPRLRAGVSGTVSVSRRYVAKVLSLAFLGRLDAVDFGERQERGGKAGNGESSESAHGGNYARVLSFVPLFRREPSLGASHRVAVARIRCLLAYFDALIAAGGGNDEPDGKNVLLDGSISIARHFSPIETASFWESCVQIVQPVELTARRIEDHHDEDVNVRTRGSSTVATAGIADSGCEDQKVAHVDFANRDLMAGEVMPSATQEEILFSIRPEMYASLLIVDRLLPEEVIVFQGCRRFAAYVGYQDSFDYRPLELLGFPLQEERRGDVVDLAFHPRHSNETLPKNLASSNRRLFGAATPVIAMDAHMNRGSSQFSSVAILTDLHKSLLGFRSTAPAVLIATGLWGCGVFGGDPVLKLVQQAMAAAVAGVCLTFSVFSEAQRSELDEVNELLSTGKFSVAKLFSFICSSQPAFSRSGGFRQALFFNLRGHDGDTPPAPVTQAELEARQLAEQARVCEEAGDYEASVQKLRRAIKLFPDLEREL